jgi:hypothetical protein
LISGFRRDVDDICAHLGYYATSSRNPLPTFRGQPTSPILKESRNDLLTHEMGPIGCAETSVKDYESLLCNVPEDRRSQDKEITYMRKSEEVIIGKLVVIFRSPALHCSCSTVSTVE